MGRAKEKREADRRKEHKAARKTIRVPSNVYRIGPRYVYSAGMGMLPMILSGFDSKPKRRPSLEASS